MDWSSCSFQALGGVLEKSAVAFIKKVEPCCINVADYMAVSLSSRFTACLYVSPPGGGMSLTPPGVMS